MAKETYAGKMRAAMRDNDIKLRDIQKKTGFSYEHLRKIRAGRSVLSKEVSDAICKELGLDPKAMWEIARVEKLQNRYGQIPAVLVSVPDDRAKRGWPLLTREQQQEVIAMIEMMARRNTIMEQPDNESELIKIIATASAKLSKVREGESPVHIAKRAGGRK